MSSRQHRTLAQAPPPCVLPPFCAAATATTRYLLHKDGSADASVVHEVTGHHQKAGYQVMKHHLHEVLAMRSPAMHENYLRMHTMQKMDTEQWHTASHLPFLLNEGDHNHM